MPFGVATRIQEVGRVLEPGSLHVRAGVGFERGGQTHGDGAFNGFSGAGDMCAYPRERVSVHCPRGLELCLDGHRPAPRFHHEDVGAFLFRTQDPGGLGHQGFPVPSRMAFAERGGEFAVD